MTDDDLAEPLYDVSATWLLKERIEAQAALIAELVEALDGALFLSDESGKVEAVRALIAKAKAVTG
jgi:predicted RNA-binding protein (virulence factor B family)